MVGYGRQAFLSQSEEDRKAAEAREATALAEAKDMQRLVLEAEEKLLDVNAELEVPPNIIFMKICVQMYVLFVGEHLLLTWYIGICVLLLRVRTIPAGQTATEMVILGVNGRGKAFACMYPRFQFCAFGSYRCDTRNTPSADRASRLTRLLVA